MNAHTPNTPTLTELIEANLPDVREQFFRLSEHAEKH